MRSLIRSLAALTLVAFSALSLAATTVPHTFTAGAPARAAEVNANFQALVTAIDTLSARVDKLDGTTPLTMADLAGTYAIHAITTELKTDVATSSPAVAAYSTVGTLTFNANGTGTTAVTDNGTRLLFTPEPFQFQSINLPFNQTFAWSVSGNVLNADGDLFLVVPGGRILVKSGVPGAGTNHLVLLVRTN